VDEQHFDAFVKSLVGIGSRRHVLRAGLTAAVGLLVNDALASGKRKKGRRKKGGKKKGRKHRSSAAPSLASPAPLSRTCPAGDCTSDNSCGAGCVCLDIGGVRRRCMAVGTCSGRSTCTFDLTTSTDSCGDGCTCVNPAGTASGCVAVRECPEGRCTSDAVCGGPDCLCVNAGTRASRCASIVR
jgi:hypothetical protein